ncbi:MAG: 23S rRNA (adenine(2030)-N(6))-methyltransferase RlmJ [Pseudomonadota bacterium]
MLSYQHGFHAGNRADVLKHAVLDAFLKDASGGRQPILYVETHSGRARYDLTGADAKKTGEAESGVIALLEDAPGIVKPWVDTVRQAGINNYPGSPALAVERLSERDRMVFFELHPTEHKALNTALGDDDRIQIRKSDGYAGALKLAPRRGERMMVFVDPSYETLRDMDAMAEWTPRALKRWPKAEIILWLPLFRDEREADFGAYLASLEDGVVAGARWKVDPSDETALAGSAIVAYRVSEGAADKAAGIAAALQGHWSKR